MYKFIESSDDVIALRLTNTITGDDLNAIMDRVDGMMARTFIAADSGAMIATPPRPC